MPTILTPAELAKFFEQRDQDEVRKKCVEAANAIKVHSDGASPQKLISERRPSESQAVMDYRQKIWKPITKIPFNKVMTELMKIRKSEEWNIEYDSTTVSNTLQEGERMADYCEKNYPVFKSVTNWVFSVLLKQYLVDPNGIIIVIPKSTEVQESDFLQPVAHVFESSQVVAFKMGDYVILKSKEKSRYTTKEKTTQEGAIFYVIDTVSIRKYEETNPSSTAKKQYKITVDYKHELGECPAFAIGSIIKEVRENHIIYESRMQPCSIEFDEAVREYSDLQAEVVKHIHSTMWGFHSQECNECKGVGRIIVEGKDTSCVKCKGSGRVAIGPYDDLILKPPSLGDTNTIPTPPMGYVTKDVQIVTIQDTRVDKHIWKGLSALNMEFLAQVPLTQSGVAKEVDRDGLNTFVNSVAEDLVRCMDQIYYFIGELRNRLRIPDPKTRLEQLPKIAVPEHFDYLHSAMMIEKLKTAREAKLHPTIIAALEIDYANSEFNSDPDIRKRLEAIYSLDPFPGISEDEKSTRLANKGISKQNYIISSNIHGFIDRAIIEDANFLKLERDKQIEKLQEYADEQIEADSAEAQVMMEAMQEGNEEGAPVPGQKQPPAKAA